MPKCSMRAADRFDRRRDHVAPVGDGGGAEHDDQLGARLQHLVDRLRERVLLVRHAALGDDRGAGRRQPLLRSPCSVFSITLVASPGSTSRRRRPCGSGRARPRTNGFSPAAERRVARGLGDRERNDLHGRDHLACDHRLEGRQRRERDRLVDAVERGRSPPCRRPARRRSRANRLARPVKARSTCTPSPGDGLGDLGRGLVLGHVARLEPRHHDVLDAGGLQRRDLGRRRSACPSSAPARPGGWSARRWRPRPPAAATGPNFMRGSPLTSALAAALR